MLKKNAAVEHASEPVALPQIDGGGDYEHFIYVESGAGPVAYASRSDRAFRVSIGGVSHEHCGEHEGKWVYRKA